MSDELWWCERCPGVSEYESGVRCVSVRVLGFSCCCCLLMMCNVSIKFKNTAKLDVLLICLVSRLSTFYFQFMMAHVQKSSFPGTQTDTVWMRLDF